MLATHRGGPGSIPGRDLSVLGPPVYDGDGLGLVSRRDLKHSDLQGIC
jgi:hypothetical protein